MAVADGETSEETRQFVHNQPTMDAERRAGQREDTRQMRRRHEEDYEPSRHSGTGVR